jgi:hypothetical protein
MTLNFTVTEAIEAAKSLLEREVVDKVGHREDLEVLASNIRRLVDNGMIEKANEELEGLVKSLNYQAMELKFNERFSPPFTPTEGFLLGLDIDREVMGRVAEACAVLGLNAPRGYTGRMFKRWGFMMGMVRQVNQVSKIGTGGFVALAKKECLHCSAEYIVYHKALEHGEIVTNYLGEGCMEHMEAILTEHNLLS